MPGQQVRRWLPVKLSLLLLVAVCAVAVLSFLISHHLRTFGSQHIVVRSYFDNSTGLKAGAPVNLDGVTVGEVSAIHFDRNHPAKPVEVDMRIKSRWAKDIPNDSQASLQSVGLLGDIVVEIDSGPYSGTPVRNGTVIATTTTSSTEDLIASVQSITQQANGILTRTNELTTKLGSQNGTVGLLLSPNDALLQQTNRTVDQVDGLLRDISRGKGSLAKLKRLQSGFHQMQSGVNRIDARLRARQGEMQELERNSREAIGNLKTTQAEMASGQNSIGQLMNNRQFREELADTQGQLSAIRTQAKSGNGSLAEFTRHRAPHTPAEAHKRGPSMSEFMQDFRRNPKKYLTLHVKLF